MARGRALTNQPEDLQEGLRGVSRRAMVAAGLAAITVGGGASAHASSTVRESEREALAKELGKFIDVMLTPPLDIRFFAHAPHRSDAIIKALDGLSSASLASMSRGLRVLRVSDHESHRDLLIYAGRLLKTEPSHSGAIESVVGLAAEVLNPDYPEQAPEPAHAWTQAAQFAAEHSRLMTGRAS